jgi:signal peptidase II
MRAIPTSRYLVFLSITAAGCLVDLATKQWIFAKPDMACGRIRWIWHGVLGFQTSLNEGALFGFGQGGGIVFIVLACIALAAMLVWLFGFGAARDWLLTIALGCVSAGVLGNLYDRLGLPDLTWPYATHLHAVGDPVHAVRDWILIRIGHWDWPNFNVADSLLVCGAVLLAWHAYRSTGPETKTDAETP